MTRIACVAAIVLQLSAPPLAFAQSSEIKIVKAEFGLFNERGSADPGFVPTRAVPHVVGRHYGWVIVLETAKPTVHWREEFILPAAPTTWRYSQPGATRALSDDYRESVIERDVTPHNGVIYNFWTVTPGDPVGHHKIRVVVEDAIDQTFEFDVQ